MSAQFRLLSLMMLVLLLAAATHFHHMEQRSLWEDEGWTLLLSDGENAADVVRTMAADQHPPLYFILMHYWRQVAGDSEFSLRALSALFSLLSVALIYALGALMLGRREWGLLAAALLAVWDFSIDVGQEARQYSLVIALVLLSTYCYFRLLRQSSPHSRRPYMGLAWVLVSVAALYTHYSAGLILAFQGLHLLAFAGRQRPRLLLYMLLMALAFLPWLPTFLRQNELRWQDPLYYQSGLPNNAQTFVLVRDALLTKQFGLVLGLAILGLGAGFQWRQGWQRQRLQSSFFLGLWVLLFTLLVVGLNEQREILRLRLFALVLPGLLLLVAAGLGLLPARARLFLVAVLLAVNLATLDTRLNNPPWREITQQVSAFYQDGEPVLLDIWVGDFPVRYYIQQQMGPDTPWLSLRELRAQAGDFFLPHLLGYLEGENAFWLMRWEDEAQPYDELLAEQGFQRTVSSVSNHLGNDIYVHRYDRLGAERLAAFGESISLLKVAVPAQATAGKPLPVALWWTVESPPPLDYSISLRLLDAQGKLVHNWDGPPLAGRSPTTSWLPGRIYYDQHSLALPPDLPPGEYELGVSVYWYVEPNAPLTVESQQVEILQEGVAQLATLSVNRGDDP